MILDARTLDHDQKLSADLCIVGAGVAGITLAREFIDQELSVLIVESGGERPKPETQRLAEGDITGRSYSSLDDACKRSLGGTSWAWNINLPDGRNGVRLRALDEIDFVERPEIPHSGWPISKKDLDPYYERAHEVFQLGPYSYSPEDWCPHVQESQMPIENDSIETTIFQFADAKLFRETYPEELRKAPNVTVLTNATVVELETNEAATTVTGLQARTLSGKSLQVVSSRFVVAAGGIQTPRLLLLSNQHAPKGLGNQNDLVGRFFMEHPHVVAGWFVPSKPVAPKELALYQEREAADGTPILDTTRPILGYLTPTARTLIKNRLPNFCTSFRPKLDDYWRTHTSEGWKSLGQLWYARKRGLPEQPHRHLAQAVADFPDLAHIAYEKLRRGFRERFGNGEPPAVRNFQLQQMAEQVPNPESRVTLASERDQLGQPRARLDWKLSPRDVQGIQNAQKVVKQALETSDLGHVDVAPLENIRDRMFGGYHHMGTTRMSASPRDGVVDSDCKVHNVSNLYIAGSSVFPTSGCANPTLTIVALALRLADHLKNCGSI